MIARMALALSISFAVGSPVMAQAPGAPMAEIVTEGVRDCSPADVLEMPLIAWGADAVTIHANGPVMHNVHAIGSQATIRMADIINRLEPAEIEVREEAGVIGARWLDQRHIDFAFAVLGNIAGGCRTPCPTAHNNHAGFAMATGQNHRRRQSS